MGNYINGEICTHEYFDYNGEKIHAVTRIRDREEGLTLLVLDISDKEKNVPIPSGERIEASRAIRRQLLERTHDKTWPERKRVISKKLLEKDMYFINNEIDAGRASGNPGVYASG